MARLDAGRFMGEIMPQASLPDLPNLAMIPRMDTRQEIMDWRRAERERQIAARMALPVAQRQDCSQRISRRLDSHWREEQALAPGTVVSAYWPLRGEPDLRPWLGQLHDEGLICVLPVVVEKAQPLRFRRWFPGCAMEKGFWNIPVPADPAEHVPQLLIAPVVGFDPQCYRLGYGGGYFDRTLASLRSRGAPFTVTGVGYSAARLDTIHPLPHDIPLQAVITEEGSFRRPPAS